MSLLKDFRRYIKALSIFGKFSLQSSENARKSRAGRDNQLFYRNIYIQYLENDV